MRATRFRSRSLWKIILIVVVFLAATLPAHSERLPIRTYSTADGLPHNVINKIVRDSRGFLWFCTDEGLARFDGYSFTSYGTEEGLPHTRVNDILETRAGQYWVATNGGLVHFTPKATPHVAGVAALYLETNPGASPATVVQSILGSATLNKLTGVGTGSPNRLLYSFVTGPLPTPTPTPTPTPSPTPPPLQNPTPSPTPNPSPTPTPSFSLSAKGIKVKGVESSNLTWSGATSTKVDIWRNSSLILTAPNNGSQKDNLNSRGAGSYTYRVCQSGTDVCSNNVTIVF